MSQPVKDPEGGVIAEDAPPPSFFQQTTSYDRSSFMFQSSYLPDDFTASGSTTGDTVDGNETTVKSQQDTTLSPEEQQGSHSSSGSTPKKNNKRTGKHRMVGFKDELSVYAEETNDDGEDSTWRGFRIVVPNSPQKPGQGTVENCNQSGVHSRAGLSTITFESNFLSIFLPKTKWSQWICILVILLLIACSVTVAVTCGRGICNPNYVSSGENNDVNTSPAPPPISSFIEPPASPSQPFQTTEELYAAVDAYLESDYDPLTSETARKYGHPMDTWRVEQLDNFTSIFDAQRNEAAATFSADLGEWNTSRAVTMRFLFRGATQFNGDVSNWDTSSVTDMEGVFSGCRAFTGDISRWQTGSVTNFRDFLAEATSFRADLGDWDVSSATDMSGMCKYCCTFLLG